MKQRTQSTYRALAFSILILSFTAIQAEAIQVSFMGRLANFDGIVPSLWSKIAVDKERTEVFVLSPRQRDVRIFNEAGMEIFGFGDDVELSGATDIDLGEEGNIYLVYPRLEQKILRLDYKGEPLAFIDLKNIPEEFKPFQPEFLQYLDGRLYLADPLTMDVIITDTEGNFKEGRHIKDALLKLEEEFSGQPGEDVFNDPKRLEHIDLTGFSADREGNIFFTISVLFSAFRMSADEELKFFGTAGSAPGKFGVVAGITTDTTGNIYVTDRLRSVVMIFDRNFGFVTEFGYRGLAPKNLIVPDDVIVDDEKGLIYVSQAANRGVSVYRITKN